MKTTFLLTTLLSLASAVLTAAVSPEDTSTKKGWSGKLSSLDGGLEGTVTVDTSGSSLTVTDYKLEDASAPALYWWGSASSSLSDGFRISNKQVTEPSGSETAYTIELDAGKTPKDFATVGLWCEKFSANFGQATLAPVEAGTDGGDDNAGSTGTSDTGAMSKSNDGAAMKAGRWAWMGAAAGMSFLTTMLL
ncbi:hypothetical protein V8F20_008771 [Naviculisporaceae sp. PSN 640]